MLPQVGGVGQRKLKAARSRWSARAGSAARSFPALAGAGVGRLTIIDDDVVELGNLHRQPLFRERDAGYSKADLALQFVHRLNQFRRSRSGAGADRRRKMRASCSPGTTW